MRADVVDSVLPAGDAELGLRPRADQAFVKSLHSYEKLRSLARQIWFAISMTSLEAR